jgi:hypothetical protein
MSNGDVVITVAGGRNAVIYLDSLGEIVQVFGRPGEGPEEFGSAPAVLQQLGDRLLLWDSRNRRIGEFGIRSRGETISFRPAEGHEVVGVLEDGVVVTAKNQSERLPELHTVDTHGHAESYYYQWRGGELLDSIKGPAMPPAPVFTVLYPVGDREAPSNAAQGDMCLPETRHIVVGETLMIAENGDGLIVSLERMKSLDTLFKSVERPRVTQEMVVGAKAFAERVNPTFGARATSESRQVFFERVGNVGDPLLSAWSDFVWGGNAFWLRRSVPCFTPPPAEYTWDVFDVQSRAHKILSVPGSMNILAAAPDRVLAVVTDRLGVESVGVFRILP